ncbi:MAG: insulinase family protein [Candidatus Zixiibacteriota bacterium]|nr:MAG: insulinase family protein [candidate division Zixibacteria bacterium]
MKKSMLWVAFSLLLAAVIWPSVSANEFASLNENQQIADFRLTTIYENEYGDPVGAEFRHVPSGFILDVLRIQSIPQAFAWVNTPCTSDKGQPHTLEHLVLGKGTKGQWVKSFEDMSISNSSAHTGQLRTVYHFHSAAGKEIFYKYMEAKIDALINPDYSDEEIRREMCDLGYSINPEDSSVQLEEKGTIYTEMITYFEGDWVSLWFKMLEMLYGEEHPLSYSAGGYPRAIREATVKDLRDFHEATYHLNNMGMVVSIGDEFELQEFLERTSEIFARIEPDAEAGEDPASLEKRLPPPQMAPFGQIAYAEYPHQNPDEPASLAFVWPAVLEYEPNEAFLRECLVDNLQSGESSNLYKKFIDSQTRLMDIGASNLFGWSSDNPGCPVTIGFSNVRQEFLTETMIDSIRSLVMDEIKKVAAYADGSEELKEFNQRVANRVIQVRRGLRDNLNKPPRFGYRGTGDFWKDHLNSLRRTEGFRKTLTENNKLEFVEGLLASDNNFWKKYIDQWKLLANLPYAVATRPNPDATSAFEAARQERIKAYLGDLKRRYGVEDGASALAKFVADYGAKTDVIEAKSASVEMPGFIDNPPLVLDEQLDYRVEKFPGGGDNVISTFGNVTNAQFGLYLDMNVVPESLLVYTSALPTLLSDVGVIKDGKPIPSDEMFERLRQEILNLFVHYDINHRTERVELAFVAAGSILDESVTAVDWLSSVLYNPDWREENLPRIRDAIDASLTGARNGMRSWEEYWIDNPTSAYWRQTNPLILSANSFLTQQHSLWRIKWMLKEAESSESQQEFESYMTVLAGLGLTSDRDKLRATATRLATGTESESDSLVDADMLVAYDKLPESAAALVKAAAGDLTQMISGLPDNSLIADWQYLCHQMPKDLAVKPGTVLDGFRAIMEAVRKKDNVRGYMVGSPSSQEKLIPLLNGVVAVLSDTPRTPQTYSDAPIVHNRIEARYAVPINPIYAGLINENTRNGLVNFTAPIVSYYEADNEALLDYLASRLYGGGGPHGLFMKTWQAGMAYSNGPGVNLSSGRFRYYAERCPSIVQTVQFVINELNKAEPDENLIDYAIAQAFSSGRAGSTYEDRASSMASDLADGLTPDKVKKFRQALIELKSDPNLFEKLKTRMLRVYGTVLPGLNPKGSEVAGSSYLAVGPETQLAPFDEYLKSVESDDITLYRVYPRDFWIVTSN